VLRSAINGSRISDRGVNATHLPRACKSVLLTRSEDYTALNKFDAAFAKLAHALQTGSQSELNDAQALLDAAAKLSDKAPTVATSLRRLRAKGR